MWKRLPTAVPGYLVGSTKALTTRRQAEWKAGMEIEEVPTPALLLNVDALERNLHRMADDCRAAGVALRPHAKTHKSPWIASRQVQLGAAGVCAAKVGEAEVLV